MIQPFTIALSSDDAYLDGLVGTLCGVARSTSDAPVHAVILDCGILDANWARMEQSLRLTFPRLTLRRLRIPAERLREFNPTGAVLRLNNSAYARLLLPELLPDCDRILYLDCDLLVDADLRPLFYAPLDGMLVGAVPETHTPTLGKTVPVHLLTPEEALRPTFNSGVLLLDLAGLRDSDIVDQIRALPVDFYAFFVDQGALNYVLRGRWKKLPARWNRQHFVTENFSLYRDHPGSVWHFIGKIKPWHFEPASMRGLIADFHRNLVCTSWIPRLSGRIRPLSPAWRDFIKATRACVLRLARGLRPASSA